ncbi:MAG: Holliday junction resolvase RuvX [Chloroflexi bacterium]|nr:Holliday junction resolvase RuvX [Chloroflexota bacterium]
MLGLDVGDKRIGLALSDPTRFLASGLTVYERTNWRRDVGTITELGRRHGVTGAVIGLPLNLLGEPTDQTGKVRLFGERLAARSGWPIVYFDEALSTVEATERLAAAGVRRAKRRAIVDQAAATIILQRYLDRQRARD